MRIAAISDVHANLPALESVISAGQNRRVDQWVFLGDLVGYYYWPLQCLELLNQVGAVMIAGNHERILCAASSSSEFLSLTTMRYGSGIEVALNQFSGEILERICSMPEQMELELDGKQILLCHGTPWDGDAYLYSDSNESMWRKLPTEYDLILYGHTHYSLQRKIDDCLIVNPGSVGQPRNHHPGAHWALLDLKEDRVELFVERYDISRVCDECCSRDPKHSYLCDVLKRER